MCMCDLGGGDVYIVYLTSLMLVCQEDLGLESLLAQYVTPEVIDNAHCPGCAKKRSASKDSSRPAIKRTLTIGKVSSGGWSRFNHARDIISAAWGKVCF